MSSDVKFCIIHKNVQMLSRYINGKDGKQEYLCPMCNHQRSKTFLLISRQTETLVRTFLRDYYGKYYRELDFREVLTDSKSIYAVSGLGYGQRMFVYNDTVYWIAICNNVLCKTRAEKLGYSLRQVELFKTQYFVITNNKHVVKSNINWRQTH